MRISDWSSDVCSSDLPAGRPTRTPVRLGAGAYLRRSLDGSPPRRPVSSTAASSRASVIDRKRVVYGKRVSVRVDLDGRRIIKNKKPQYGQNRSIDNINVTTISHIK